jgi:hypothetical protein
MSQLARNALASYPALSILCDRSERRSPHVAAIVRSPPQIAVIATTELSAFGRVDAPEANAGAVGFQRVAVDDAGPADQVAAGEAAPVSARENSVSVRRPTAQIESVITAIDGLSTHIRNLLQKTC